MKFNLQYSSSDRLEDSEKEKSIRGIFGLHHGKTVQPILENLELANSGIVYITGYSGTGKSSLLRLLQKKFPEAENAVAVIHPERSVVECFDASVEKTISWLGRFGLGEARVLLTRYSQLSVGQKERLKLALALWKKPKVLILDEFLSSVDRTTARIISFQLQKTLRREGCTAYLATAHSDLEDALFPDQYVELDFEASHKIREHKWVRPSLKEAEEIEILEGDLEDYRLLKRFHYMDSQAGDEVLSPDDVVCIKKATFRGHVVGVRVFTKIYPSSFENFPVFKHINQFSALSSRVIVHPVFRNLGISTRLNLQEGDLPGIDHVFTHSALARFIPFDKKSNYLLKEHPSENRTELHDKYEVALRKSGLIESHRLHDKDFAESFWSTLNKLDKETIQKLAVEIITDYDQKYFDYICSNIGIELNPVLRQKTHKFFEQLNSRTVHTNMLLQLSEALHFPMQGLHWKRTATKK